MFKNGLEVEGTIAAREKISEADAMKEAEKIIKTKLGSIATKYNLQPIKYDIYRVYGVGDSYEVHTGKLAGTYIKNLDTAISQTVNTLNPEDLDTFRKLPIQISNKQFMVEGLTTIDGTQTIQLDYEESAEDIEKDLKKALRQFNWTIKSQPKK